MECLKCKSSIDDDSLYCKYCGKKQQKTVAPKALKRANGMGSVYKLSGRRKKPWAVSIGGIVLGSYETRTAALQALELVPKDHVADIYNITVGDIHKRWKETEGYKRLSKSAKENYRYAWTRLAPQEKEKMRDMKTAQFQLAINLATESGVKRDTCEKIRSLCSLLCQNAMQDDIIDKNYALLLDLPKKEITEKRNFTDEEILTLFYNDSNDNVKIVLCLIYCGMRINEFLGLKKENVNLEQQIMVGGSKTTAGKNRSVPIHPSIKPYIEYFYHKGSSDGYLVTNTIGTQIQYNNFLNRTFYPLLKSLGIPCKNECGKNILTPHRARHTFVAGAIENNMSPDALMKIAGYSKYETAVNKYDDIVNPKYLADEIKKSK